MPDTSPATRQLITRAVWKFPLPAPGSDVFTIEMPQGAEPLTVQVQNGAFQIWALVTPGHPTETRVFRIAGTGHPIDEIIVRHVGTVQLPGLGLVFHVFEVAP